MPPKLHLTQMVLRFFSAKNLTNPRISSFKYHNFYILNYLELTVFQFPQRIRKVNGYYMQKVKNKCQKDNIKNITDIDMQLPKEKKSQTVFDSMPIVVKIAIPNTFYVDTPDAFAIFNYCRENKFWDQNAIRNVSIEEMTKKNLRYLKFELLQIIPLLLTIDCYSGEGPIAVNSIRNSLSKLRLPQNICRHNSTGFANKKNQNNFQNPRIRRSVHFPDFLPPVARLIGKTI